MTQRCGDTLLFRTPPVIAAQAAVGGKKEGEGPLAAAFDELSSDNRFGQSSWEAAEKYLQLRAARLCLQKAQLPEEKVRLVLAGDLQAQCTASGYAMRELGVPFAGVFGACSTMAETLGLGAALCASGAAEHLLAMASSHFCAAERQFRTPLSYGAVRTPTAQWTVTAAGCCLLQPAGPGVPIAAATFGRVQDYQVRDINNMGAAMAPAAASTLLHYFADTHTEPQEFDCIYTGDLGQVGSSLLRELLAAEGLLVKNHVDCGCILFDTREGGSAKGMYAMYTEIVQALDGSDAFYCRYDSHAFLSRGASPVVYRNRIIGAVYAYEYDTQQAELLQSFQTNLTRISLLIGVLVVALSALLSRAFTRKIRELLQAIRQVREGAYSHRASVRGNDEIAQLATEFNSLTDRLQTTEAARRRFVSDASHELKTPLAAIRLLTDSILQTDNMDMATVRDFVTDIGSEAQRLSSITEDLLRLTRLDSGLVDKPKRVEVVPVLEQVMRMMSFLAQDKGTELTYQAEEGCAVMATRGEVHQVIYNLTDNAVKYSGNAGSIRVRLFREGGCVVLTVADNGPGIPEEDLPRVFERFYRVDKARSRAAGGTGLGLSIVRDTVLQHGGAVTARRREPEGTCFEVSFAQWNGEEVGR